MESLLRQICGPWQMDTVETLVSEGMISMKRSVSKALSIVLSVAMLCTSVPGTAYAGGWGRGNGHGHGRGWWPWDYIWDDWTIEEDDSSDDQSVVSDLEQDPGSDEPLFEEDDQSGDEGQSQDGITVDPSDEDEEETGTEVSESETGESGTETQASESETGESGTESEPSGSETETVGTGSESETGTEAQTVQSETEAEALSYTQPVTAQLTADDLQVTVDAPVGAFPDGTTVTAQKVTLDDVDVNGTVLAAADITFLYGGNEVEPKDGAAVSVTIQSAEIAKADADTLSVVHVDDNNEVTPVAESDVQVQDDQVVFDASEFSVYAVVTTGSTDPEARATVNFYGKDKALVSTVYVKNSDTLEELETIVYDPGAGTLAENDMFLGWTTEENYDADSEARSISEVRADLEKKQITEGDVVNYYAKIAEKAEVVYVAPNGVIINRESKLVYNDQPVDVTIDTNYTPETDAKGFLGWTVSDDISRVNISEAAYEGNDVTAGGTEENPYQVGTALKITGNVTLNAYAPEGYWLVFDENGKGATYNAPQFVKSGDVRKEPSREMTRPGYDFKGWYTDKDCTDGNEFSFGSALTEKTTIYAKWVAKDSADYTVVIWKQNVDGKNYDFAEAITYTATANSVISPVSKVNQTDKAGADNSYAKINTDTRQYEGFHLEKFDQDVTVKPEGDSIVNVYFERTEYTLTFKSDTGKYVYTYTETTEGYSLIGGDQYGFVNGKYVKLSYGMFGDYWYYRNRRNKIKYTGTRYKRTSTWVDTIKTITALYGQNILDQFNPFTGVDGTVYDCTWTVSQTPNGKFVTGNQLSFLNTMPADNAVFTSFTYSGKNSYTFNFYLQNLPSAPGEEKTYSLAKSYVLNSDGLTSTKNEDFVAIEGFSQERSDPEYDSDGYYIFPYRDSEINFYYTRNQNSIVYRDGTCFGKETVAATEKILKEEKGIYYQAAIDSYGSYQPTKDGYTFAGWYVDATCTVPYEFIGTMPDHSITVYAKWQQNEYRVFLHPNVDSSDASLDWGSDDQAMNFRIYDGDKISLPTGLRDDYELVGWYSDEACTQVYSEDTRINSTTAETLAQDYDQTTHMTDEMDKYGNITGTGTNSDAENGRTWITKEVNLYAKWRSKLNGAKGINIVYDANGGSNAPTDNSFYLDQALAIAQAASTAPEGKKFSHWVMQKWDGTAYVDTDVTVEPGKNFTVLKENAKAEELEGSTKEYPKYRYTIQLRAEYVGEEQPEYTEIHWHSNIQDVFGNTLTVDLTKPSDATPNTQVANDYVVTDILAKDGTSSLEINKAVDIRSADTFSYAGMTFLGWAKTADANENELFLKWDESTGKYTTTEGTEVKEVSQVAADLKDPAGNDLYACWQGKFYIYHSGVAGDGNLQTVVMNHGQMPDGTYDLTKTVTSGTLYGGYYLDYAGKGSYKDDGKAANDGIKYDGMNETWVLTDAQTASGKTLKPVAGETYYIKEVPTYYLLPRYEYTYTMADKKIQSMFLFSAIDDLNYSGIGFVVQEENKSAKVYKSFTVKAANGTAQAKLTPTRLFGDEGLTSGGRLTEYRDDSLITNTSFTFRPYWTTMDGVTVLGSVKRTVNMGDGTINAGGISPDDQTVGAEIR